MNTTPLTSKLKDWTESSSLHVVYDSDIDEFSNVEFLNHCLSRPNIAVVGMTSKDDVFGVFFGAPVDTPGKAPFDPSHFIFSFQSNGRCVTPQRWFVKARAQASFFSVWFSSSECGFLRVGDFAAKLFFGNSRSKCFAYKTGNVYDGLDNAALTGTDDWDADAVWHFTRLLVLQCA